MSFYISRTPHRISLFGGSSDIKDYFEQYPGTVVGFAINKYSYITARRLPQFHNYKSKIVYSDVEQVNDNSEIKHRIVNKVLQTLGINDGLEIIHSSDIPSGGTGASASFCCSLVNALEALNNNYIRPEVLYKIAVMIERDCLLEKTGLQDSIFAAYGGFKIVHFYKERVDIFPFITSDSFIKELENSLVLIHTGISRPKNFTNNAFNSSNIQKIKEIVDIAKIGIKELQNQNIIKIGEMLDDSWKIKRSLSPNVSNQKIDDIYNKIKGCGGYARLIGGGGGGFFLTVFPNKINKQIELELNGLTMVKFKIEHDGSRIIYAER